MSAQSEARGSVRKTDPVARGALKVLMVSDVDPVHVIGGAERILNEHCTRLAARGHRVVVLTRREDPALAPEEHFRGVRVVRHAVAASQASPVRFMASVLREGRAAFEQLLEAESFDLINVHQPLAAASVLRSQRSRSVPVLYTYLSPWSEEYRTRVAEGGGGSSAWHRLNAWIRKRVERQALDRCSRMLVLSEFSAGQLRELHNVSDRRIALIPGGVDTDRFRPPANREALRREFGFEGGPALLTVRNLVPRMGLEALITAIRTVADRAPGVRLYIGGKGVLRDVLERQVREQQLEGMVRFLGFIPEARLPDYYSAADCFVLPTRCLEGFGLVTVEALACGTPVLGTPIGGTQEILRKVAPDYLFASTEPDALAERILEQLPDFYNNAALRNACRVFAEEEYAWDALILRIEHLMQSMIPAKSSAGISPRESTASCLEPPFQ